jgi:hypothetical protein
MATKKKTAKKKAATPVKPITEKSKYIQELASTKSTAEKKAKSGHYVNNAEMLALIIQHKINQKEAKKAKKPKPKIPDILGKQLLLIAENLAHKPNFHNYPCRDEMIGDAIENCIMYFDNFNPKRSKYPFAYFTKIIYYAFVRRVQKEKKHLYVKYKATQQAGILHEAESGDSEDGAQQFELYDNIAEFIDKYEDAQARAKAKSAATAAAKIPVKKGLEKLFEEPVAPVIKQAITTKRRVTA